MTSHVRVRSGGNGCMIFGVCHLCIQPACKSAAVPQCGQVFSIEDTIVVSSHVKSFAVT